MSSFRIRYALFLVIPALALLAACGSSTHNPQPPPTGGFSNSNLNGTYVFSTSGADSSQNGGFLTIVGAFSADGNGGIKAGGNVDVNGGDVGPSSAAITGGNYSITKDGRGKVTLDAVTSLPAGTITLDIVLSSSSGGVVTEFDNDGSGSGTFDLQTMPTQAQLQGTYVFNLAGVTSTGSTLGTVGAITLDASGNVTTGVQDINVAGTPGTLPIGPPSNVLVGTVPGTAAIGSFTFDVYPIDSTHAKIIETDAQGILSGDVFSQTSTSFPSGEMAFTMAGFDITSQAPLVVGGMMNSNGTSSISNGLEDFNDGGTIDASGSALTPQAFTGSLVQTGGRWLLTLDSFMNGNGGLTGTFTFAAYPSSVGVQLLEIETTQGVVEGITQGTAFAQTNTTFATGQGYGLNLAAVNTNSEEDDIVEFTNTNNNLTGLIDVNDEGSTNNPSNFSGTYAPDSTNAGRGVINANDFTLATYTVDSSTTIGIEVDNSQLGLAVIGLQNPPQGAAVSRLVSLRSKTSPRVAMKKRKR